MGRNHPICARCAKRRYPDRRGVTVQPAKKENCCWCGQISTDGLYMRELRANVPKCTCVVDVEPPSAA